LGLKATGLGPPDLGIKPDLQAPRILRPEEPAPELGVQAVQIAKTFQAAMSKLDGFLVANGDGH
jgi:hypothetical protein